MRKNVLILLVFVISYATQAQNITQFEYFFDSDPGYGAGTILNVTPSAAITDLNIPVSTSSLSTGFHKLYIRAQNANNEWTHTHLRSFYIVPFVAAINITQIEYFIDTDPGIGSATQVSFTAATTITNLAIDISVVPLTPGFHKLYVRTKSSDGQWTHTHLRSFYVANVGVVQNLVKFEYFFDADPGFDNGTAASITPAAPSVTNQDIFADVSSLTIGSHTIYVRAKDSGGEWTQVSTGTFSVSAALPPTITSFTPASAPVGATITITGTNFNSTPANNMVIFGATRATVSVATSTQLTVTVPAGATYAPITVLNTATALLAYSKSNFTPTFSPNKGSITSADFDPKIDLTTDVFPFNAAVGDLDGDGKADLAFVNNGNNSVAVFRNTSTGPGNISYSAKVDFAGASPRFVSIGDLDGDGKLDLAVANSSTSISVFRNTSTGAGNIGFATKVDFSMGTLLPRSIAIGDLDGDGKADLVVGNVISSVISTFRNTSSGVGNINFATKADFTTGSDPISVAIGDFDGDGKADLAVGNNSSNTVSVLRNTSTGAGSIAYATKVDFATTSNPYSIAIGDLDGDTKQDIAVTNYNSASVSVLRNTSVAGTISYSGKVDFTTGNNPISVAISDFDGDSKQDLAVANNGSVSVSVLRSISTGSGNISYETKVDYSTGSNAASVSTGDLDNDGKTDLVVSNNGSASISLIRNDPVFPPTITSFTPTSGPSGTTVTLTGTNFTGATSVTFGGTSATSFNVVSSTSITAVVGTGTSGKISVTTPAGSATSITDFTIALSDLIAISTQPTSTAVCEGSTASFTLAATGTTNITYQWQKFNGTAFVDITNGGVYTGATSATLTINTLGNVGIEDFRCKLSGDNSPDKFSNTVTLTVNANPTAPTATGTSSCVSAAFTLTASGGSNGQYRWYTTATGGTALSGQVNSTYTTPVITATTSYFVSINNGTCESIRTEVKATILTIPNAPAVTGSSNCGPGTVTLQATGATNGQYRWYDVASGGTPLAGETNATFTTPALTSTTTYYVSINNGSCESSRTAALAAIFNPPAKPSISASEPISSGIVQLCLSAITLTAPAGFSYTWSNGQTTQSISVTQAGNYSVAIKDNNACSSVSSDVVQVVLNSACTNKPPAINATSLLTTIGGAVSVDLTSYISDPDNNIDPASIQVVGNKTQRGGKTTLTGFQLDIDYTGVNFSGNDVVNIRICDLLNVCIEQEFAIEVVGDITIYNGISPNGDGTNDTWIVEYIDLLPATEKNKVTLYNRWGDVVWQATDYNNVSTVFTGLNKNGSELPTGSYFYKIEFKSVNGVQKPTVTGYLSLKR